MIGRRGSRGIRGPVPILRNSRGNLGHRDHEAGLGPVPVLVAGGGGNMEGGRKAGPVPDPETEGAAGVVPVNRRAEAGDLIPRAVPVPVTGDGPVLMTGGEATGPVPVPRIATDDNHCWSW